MSDQAIQEAVVRETRGWVQQVKVPAWMTEEADRLGLPEDQRTVGAFIECLGGEVVGWHPRADR